MKRPIVSEIVTAGAVAVLSVFDRWLNRSAHPVARRVRDERPAEWETQRVEREILEHLADLDRPPSTKPEASK